MSRKLIDGLIQEKTPSSYAYLHHEIIKNEADNSLKHLGNQQKQATCRRESEEEELVKYMSSLPGFLERGEKIPEKFLNAGVIDWASLEQWQHSQKHVPHRSSRSSTCSSDTLSSVPTEELPGLSKKGLNQSPSCQRIISLSLQSHFTAFPIQDHSKAVKSCGGSVGNCQNLRGSHSNIGAQQTGDPLPQDHSSSSILKGSDRKHLHPHINQEMDMLPSDRTHETISSAMLEMSNQDGRMEKKVENSRELNIDTDEQDMLGRSQPIVLLLPRDIPQYSHCGAPDMPTSLDQKLGSPSRTRFSVKRKETSCRNLNCNIPCSCSVPDELCESHSQPKESGCSSINSESLKFHASTLSAPVPVRMGMSPSTSRKAEERKHMIAVSSSTNGPPKEVDQKVTTEKLRGSSPFRRFNFNVGFNFNIGITGNVSGCKEVMHVPHQSSIAETKSSSGNSRGYASSNISSRDKRGNSDKSRSSPLRRFLDPLVKPKAANCHRPMEFSQKDSENARGCTSSNIGYKSGDAGKSRSSPLRRLLDPLLKPKTENCDQSMNLFQKESSLSNKNCRSGNGKFSTLQPDKDLDRARRFGCSTVNTIDSSNDKNHVPSMTQALLRISVKNGRPLFTFAVDNNSNILAATVKDLTVSRRGECSCIFTFFTFSDVKRKNGSWMNHAGKSKGSDYVHHAIAQMNVSNLHYSDSNHADSSIAKEFVLFSVNLKQGDAQVTDYQPNDELAAVVVKSPKPINYLNYAHHGSCQNERQDLPRVTVVLPSGVHSLPSNGGPSSLIDRWKTGGSCDCGGWDLACKLKILANKDQTCMKPRTSKAYFTDQYDLFFQGNDQEQENQPAFKFSPFESGVYSVAFGSSVSHLQAFSICIALVDGKLPYEPYGSRNSIKGEDPMETPLVQTDEQKAHGKSEDIPGSYVAYPLLSPVGRI